MSYYNEYSVERFENPPAWASPDAKRKNLLLGVPVYGISSDCPLGSTFETEYYNTKENSALLTDGRKCEKATSGDGAFFHFTRGTGRSVVFRLKGVSAVEEIKIGFLREESSGVRLPRRVDVLFSENGIGWERVVKARSLVTQETAVRYELAESFPVPYKTLYILVEFEVPCHVWVDEIEAFGTEAIPQNARDITAETDEEKNKNSVRHPDKYPEYSDFLGVRNLLLSYNCVPPEKVGENGLGLITKQQYIPHLLYIDPNGDPKDTFFDSFLYLPYSVYTYSYLYKCAEGWKYYVDNVFAKNRNLDALDEAAREAGRTLGMENHRVNVFFSILGTKVGYGDFPEKFGDLDGDGIDEDMSTLKDRKNALKWIIDEQYNRYKEKAYQNVVLGGFYWFEEIIDYNDAFELELLAYARDYVHSLGLKFFWIPYFQAWGFQDWKENGFDLACMQPNYAFNKKETVQRLYDNAAITKRLGMCVELEIGGLKPDDIERYKCYLDVGAETGYMHTVKMYYQGGVPGEFYRAFKSEDPLVRSVYDDTYLFAKGKYIPRKER